MTLIIATLTDTMPSNEAENMSNLLMFAGVALLVIWSMLTIRRRYARRKQAHMDQEAQGDSPQPSGNRHLRQQHAMTDQLRTMMIELEDLTRRFSAQLDAKSMRVEKLLDAAEDQIAQLEQRYQSLPPEASPPAPGNPGTPGITPAPGTPGISGTPGAIPTSVSTTPENSQSSHNAPAKPTGHHPSPQQQNQPDPLTEKTYQLSDQGLTPLQIAQELKEHIGKIELILALRQTPPPPEPPAPPESPKHPK